MKLTPEENNRDVFPEAGETYEEAMRRMLIRVLKGTFIGGTVVEVGAWNGKNVEVVRAIGAERVVALEPHEITDEIDQTLLATADEFIHSDLEGLLKRGAEQFDGFVAFNAAPTNDTVDYVFQLYELLNSSGVGIITLAEQVRSRLFKLLLVKLFDEVETMRELGASDMSMRSANGQNAIIIKVARKKPGVTLVELKDYFHSDETQESLRWFYQLQSKQQEGGWGKWGNL